MNQHINKLEDPVVAQLRKAAATSAQVNRAHRVNFPRFVRIPGRKRPVPTGWQAHRQQGVLA